jgi:hypothetical protein
LDVQDGLAANKMLALIGLIHRPAKIDQVEVHVGDAGVAEGASAKDGLADFFIPVSITVGIKAGADISSQRIFNLRASAFICGQYFVAFYSWAFVSISASLQTPRTLRFDLLAAGPAALGFLPSCRRRQNSIILFPSVRPPCLCVSVVVLAAGPAGGGLLRSNKSLLPQNKFLRISPDFHRFARISTQKLFQPYF